MKFAIIAAGEGSRLKKDGFTVPKPLVKINGIPMIKRLIDFAIKYNASSVNCIINRQSPELYEYLTKNDFGIELNLLVNSTPSSLHSLLALERYLKDEPFLLTTADTIFKENDFKNFTSFINSEKNCDGILAVTDFIDDEKPLCVELNNNNEIIEFFDRKDDHKFATAGIYYFSNNIFSLKEKVFSSNIFRLRNFLRLIIKNGFVLKAFRFNKVIDVDHKKDLLVAEEFLNAQTE